MNKQEFNTYIGANSKIELEMRKTAAKVHEEVNQHYDEHPYFYHLNKVANNVAAYVPEIVTKQEDILPIMFGAYFHDSIEDARLTYNDVMKIAKTLMSDEQAFLAAEIVYALTNEKGRNRHERANEKYYKGIRDIPYAPLVKACDRLSNYEFAKSTKSRMVKMYELEMEEFISHITTEGEKDIRYTLPEELLAALRSRS